MIPSTHGLGGWTVADIVEYLKTGSNDKSVAAGPMAEVVQDSTQYLTDADLAAVATYLKDVPRTGSGDSSHDADKNRMSQGAAVYADNCTGCHMDGGQGMANVFPPLKGSAAIQAKKPDTIINVVLGGAAIPATKANPTGLKMPNFHDKLDNAQVAAVVTCIRNAWGNHASSASAGDVADMRKQMRQKDDWQTPAPLVTFRCLSGGLEALDPDPAHDCFPVGPKNQLEPFATVPTVPTFAAAAAERSTCSTGPNSSSATTPTFLPSLFGELASF